MSVRIYQEEIKNSLVLVDGNEKLQTVEVAMVREEPELSLI